MGFQLVAQGAALFGADGRIAHWNAAAVALTGTAAGDAAGRDVEWLHGLDDPPWPDDARARADAGEVVAHEGRRRGPGDSRFWFRATLQGLHDEDGELCGYLEAFGDVTELKAADDALRDTAALFQTALRGAPLGLAMQDSELRYSWLPTGVATLGGVAGGDGLGCADADLYPPDAAARLTELKREVLRGGRGSRSELAVADDGATRYFDLTLEPLRDEHGAVVGVITAAFDVTDRTLAEQEIERGHARLAEAERLARLGSWEWDIASNRLSWSDGLFAIYGITREEFDPLYRPSPERVHPDDRARMDAEVRRAVETCEPIDTEYRIVRPDGRVRRVHGRAEVIVGADGRPVRLAGTAQDVTEARVTAEALSDAAAELGRRAAELESAARPGADGGLEPLLTARQLEVLGLVAQGLSNAEIGRRLFLSEGTVKWHVRKILRALGVANRAQAVARYLAAGPPGR